MSSRRHFFADGIRFRCTDCGACCTGAAGKVEVTDTEIARIATFLNMDESSFRTRYVRQVDGRGSLTERSNGDCDLFVDGRCSIHPVKPAQCRLYPFWVHNMRSEQAWERTCAECPGIGEGRFYPEEEILELLDEDIERVRRGD